MSIQVKEFAFVFHVATDIPASRKFYEDVLGLKVEIAAEVAPGKWYIEYDVAGQALGVSNAMPGKPTAALALEVADLDAAFKSAQADGVPIAHQILDFPPCRMFVVKDPAGNEITLHQRKAKA